MSRRREWLEAPADGQPEGDGFQRMDMAVGDAVCGLARQAIDIPKLRRVGPGIENVVEPSLEPPAAFKIIANLAIPFAIAAGAHRIVGGEWIGSEVTIFQARPPGPQMLHIGREVADSDRRRRDVAADMTGAVVILLGIARMTC